MPLTQSAHRRLRLVFSIRTASTVAAALYGYYVSTKASDRLADALSVGLTVGAVAFAVAFALGAAIRRSKSPAEMLYRDRELATLGVSSLRSAVAVALLALSYVGLSGALPQEGHLLAALGAASAASLAWLLCSMPRLFLRHVLNVAGADDEYPELDGFWKTTRRLRREAAEDLRPSPSGWYVQGSPLFEPRDSPAFVSQELAIRYGALRSEAQLHYSQLCDRPDRAEAADRVERLMACLEEMERLRRLEQQMRALLPQDPKTLKWLL